MGTCIGQRQHDGHHQPTDNPKSQPKTLTNKPIPTNPEPPDPKPQIKSKEPPPKNPPKPKPSASKIEIKIQTNPSSPLKLALVQLDEGCHMIKSYVNENKITFWKEGYNWHSLPIKSRIDIKVATVFSVRNVGVKYNHFIAGVISQSDLHALTMMPWKTKGVICYQSCSKKEGSWMRHGEGFKLPVRDVKNGEVLSTVVRQANIQFWIDNQFQGRTDIPIEMLQKPLLPYVVAFCSGDCFQILPNNPLVPYNPPQ